VWWARIRRSRPLPTVSGETHLSPYLPPARSANHPLPLPNQMQATSNASKLTLPPSLPPRLSRAGLRPHERPLGVFLFLGPTGVGKTHLTKKVCEFLFQDERAMTRLDMTEFGEKFTVSRLIGSPPGYVGYEVRKKWREGARGRR